MAQRLIITLSDQERMALERLARDEFRPLRDQVRVLVRDEALRRGVWPEPAEALFKTVSTVRK